MGVLEKIKRLIQNPYIEQFRDVRMVGFVVFGAVVLLVSWSGVNVIQANFTLQKQISELQQRNQVAELENTNLKLQNQYYNTEAYQELVAREQFGRALPGETLLLVPKTIALAHSVEPLPQDVPEVKKEGSKPFYQVNFEAWKAFLFRGNQTEVR